MEKPSGPGALSPLKSLITPNTTSSSKGLSSQIASSSEILENIEESWGLSAEERVKMGRIRDELEKTILLEEICWRQKSRVLCVREGDRNTKFFHRIANSHRRVNSIDRLMVDGELSWDQAAIANCIS